MSITQPALLVAGLGRCGSSLTMQMLAAADIPCVGSAPRRRRRDALQLSAGLTTARLNGRANVPYRHYGTTGDGIMSTWG